MKSRKPLLPKLSPNLLKRLSKSVLAIALSVCLVFGYSYKQPVKAEAVVTTVGGTIALVALCSTIGCALGIGLGGQNAYGDWTYYYRQVGDYVTNKFKAAGKTIADSGVLDFMSDQANGKLYHASDELVKATYEGITAQFPPGTSLPNVVDTPTFINTMNWSSTFSPDGNQLGSNPWGNNLNLKQFTAFVLVNTYTYSSLPISINGLSISVNYEAQDQFKASVSNNMASRFDFSNTFTSEQGNYFNKNVQFAEVSAATSEGWKVWMLLDNTGNYGWLGSKSPSGTPSGSTSVPTNVPYVPGNKDIYAQGHSVMNNSYDDVLAKIHAAQGTLDGINLRIGDAVGSLQEINDQIKAQTQSQVLGTTIADAATDAAANAATNAGRDTSIPKIPTMPDLSLPTGIQRKFPFCLPWDLAACYRLFQVTPKAPVWNIPIKIDVGMVHVDKTYTYDLNSMGVLDQALPVFKWFEDLLFVLGLILITRKIMS